MYTIWVHGPLGKGILSVELDGQRVIVVPVAGSSAVLVGGTDASIKRMADEDPEHWPSVKGFRILSCPNPRVQ